LNKLFFSICKLALVPFLALVIFTIGQQLYSGSLQFNPQNRLWFFVVFTAGILIRILTAFFSKRFHYSNPFHFIDTLEHELTHALFGYLTLSPPKSLWASHENEGKL